MKTTGPLYVILDAMDGAKPDMLFVEVEDENGRSVKVPMTKDPKPAPMANQFMRLGPFFTAESDAEAFEATLKQRDTQTLLRFCGLTLTEECHGASKRSGWWQDPDGNDLTAVILNPKSSAERLLRGALVAQKLCLVHSEVSEGMEGDRKGKMDDKLPHRTMLEVELADAVIRIFDLAGAMQLDIGGAIAEKMAFNAQRPDHKLENRQKADGKKY